MTIISCLILLAVGIYSFIDYRKEDKEEKQE